MDYKIVFYSRTGNCKRIAEKLSEKLSCEVVELKDIVSLDGVFGAIKGCIYAAMKKDVDFVLSAPVEGGNIILICPSWGNRMPPAVRTFCKTQDVKNIDLIISSSSTRINRKTGFKSLHEIVEKENNEDSVIENF